MGQIKAALAVQPVATKVDANSDIFRSYSGGILDSEDCGTYTNHSMLFVGWGYDDYLQKEFWLLKNSMGTTWGDNGYIRIGISGDGNGICGVQERTMIVTSNY